MNRWRQLEDAVFYAALQVEDPERRMLFLDKACARQRLNLRAAVDDLLSANADAERFFARGASVLRISEREVVGVSLSEIALTHRLEAPADGQVGHHIGHYRLLQKLGEGGGGVVYMAEQKEPVRRRVALKIIKLGMDTRQVIARFEAERQALALMDHPNIARVLDAGATETGRPYFVMELVRGVKITDFCDQNRLDTRQRLDLFIQICHAIQHAHQKGIIHRDIKPSNVLVTPQDGVPVPKVIDFGIAKAIESPLTDKTLFTAFEQFIGTPAYVSPEQAQFSALDVDTRTDIYSLGVLLYELLTGRTPFDWPKAGAIRSGRTAKDPPGKGAATAFRHADDPARPRPEGGGVTPPRRAAQIGFLVARRPGLDCDERLWKRTARTATKPPMAWPWISSAMRATNRSLPVHRAVFIYSKSWCAETRRSSPPAPRLPSR